MPVTLIKRWNGILKRDLGVLYLIFIAVISVIGSGVLVVPTTAEYMAGPASLLSVIIAGVSILIFLLLYAELSSEIPVTGGTVRYPDISHGNIVSAMIGYGLLLAYVVSPPLVLEIMLSYLSYFFPSVYQNGNITSIGIAVASLIFIIFYIPSILGVKLTGLLSALLGSIKAIIIFVFALLLILFAFHPSNFTAYHGFIPYGINGVALAVSAGGLFFAFTGFRLIFDFAGEAKYPRRAIPGSVLLSFLIVFVIYMLVQVAVIGGINWTGLQQYSVIPGNWSSLSSLSSPLSQIALSNGLSFLSDIILFFAVYSPLVFVVPVLGAEARLLMGLVDNGYAPKVFNTTSKKYGSPYVAVTFILILTIITLILLPRYSSILSLVSSAYGFTYATIGVQYSVIVKHLSSSRFKVPLGKILAPISMILGGFVVFWSGYPSTLWGLIVMLLFIPVYFYYNRDIMKIKEDLRAGWWFIVYSLLLFAISYLGSQIFGGLGLVNSTESYLLIAVISLVFYWVGVKSGKREINIDKVQGG
ncbi:ABC transporter permease [Sulfolobales archaeon HS-7]|nr:ABC transporter permease [Sulfolobales archaeon HS-7]